MIKWLKIVCISLIIAQSSWAQFDKVNEFNSSFNYFYIIEHDSLHSKTYSEKFITNKDSINQIKQDFAAVNLDLQMVTKNTKIDLLAYYKLKYITIHIETSHIQNPFTSSTSTLKINNLAKEDNKQFTKLDLISLFSEKFIVQSGFPIRDVGNTYESLKTFTYYYEKVN